LIANECIDYYLRTNQAGVLCKLDIEKAYDNVSWKFLLAILQKMDFQTSGGDGGDGFSSASTHSDTRF